MKNSLILLAGGIGKRLGNKVPKQFVKFGNTSLIEYFLAHLDKSIFNNIIIAVSNKNRKKYLNSLKKQFPQHQIVFTLAGKSRQESSNNALKKLKKIKPKNVLIHDSARPIVSNKLILKIIKSLEKNTAAIPFIYTYDLIKIKSQQKIKVVDNNSIHSEFFLRLLVTDVKGVLAKVTGIFNDHNVSIEALIQKQVDENNNAHIAITTDKVSTKTVMSIKKKIEASEFNQADVQIIHIELLD